MPRLDSPRIWRSRPRFSLRRFFFHSLICSLGLFSAAFPPPKENIVSRHVWQRKEGCPQCATLPGILSNLVVRTKACQQSVGRSITRWRGLPALLRAPAPLFWWCRTVHTFYIAVTACKRPRASAAATLRLSGDGASNRGSRAAQHRSSCVIVIQYGGVEAGVWWSGKSAQVWQ